jgi:Na+/phosphate symporter
MFKNMFILSLPVIVSILFFATSLNLIKNSVDPIKELKGADNVLGHVFKNLAASPILDVV